MRPTIGTSARLPGAKQRREAGVVEELERFGDQFALLGRAEFGTGAR